MNTLMTQSEVRSPKSELPRRGGLGVRRLVGALQCGTALVSACAGFEASAQDLSLWYAQPAAKWLEALPIGNGSLGGMIFGGTTNERVQFNEQTLWLGSETEMGSYQPFGDVFVEWTHAAPTEYRRELNLADATHRVRYQAGGVTFQREAFSSHPDQVMAVPLHRGPARRLLGRRSGSPTCTRRGITADGNKITAVGTLTNGLDYEAQLWVLNEGGSADGGEQQHRGGQGRQRDVAAGGGNLLCQ